MSWTLPLGALAMVLLALAISLQEAERGGLYRLQLPGPRADAVQLIDGSVSVACYNLWGQPEANPVLSPSQVYAYRCPSGAAVRIP